MGILNNTSDGLYSTVAVLYRTLAQRGPMPMESLVDLCSIGADSSDAHISLNRWRELGLFESPDGERVRIAPAHAPARKLDDIGLTEHLRRAALRVAMTTTNTANPWTSEGATDFARGIAWWLAQDVYTLPRALADLQGLELAQVADPQRQIVQNEVRAGRLREWAVFLGFAWRAPASALVIDPAPAIDWVLDEVLPVPGKDVAAAEFLHALSVVLPVLDGGSIRRAIEAELRPQAWAAPEPGWLSTSLSRALMRLHEGQRIALVKRADAGSAIRLRGRAAVEGARAWIEFTHVVRRGEPG